MSAPVWMVRQEISYKSQTARISTVVEYEFEGDSSSPGDSGSAIVSDSNLLLAMHIAGVDNQPTGYAIPINLLMRADVIGIDLELA